MSSVTEQFQNVWSNLLWERPDGTFDEKLEQLQQLAEKGADLNFPFESHASWEPNTPLTYLLFVYGGGYYTLNGNQCQQLLIFLLTKGVIPDQLDIMRATVYPKALEQLLYFAKEEDIKFYNYRADPLCLEVLLGFPGVRIDQESCYDLSYVTNNTAICSRVFRCIPIEQCMMDYARNFGSAITTTEQRQEVMRILKKNGTPPPRIGLLKEMIDIVDTEEVSKRFMEAYDYWKSI